MRTLQFNHDRNFTSKGEFQAKGGRTIALEVPSTEEYDSFKVLSEGECFPSSITLKIGIAECSKKDHYNKKLGRNISVGRMRNVVFYARKEGNKVYLVASNENLGLTLILRKTEESNRVFFLDVV